MRAAAHDHDAPRGSGDDMLEQVVRQQEVAQVIDRELALHAIRELQFRQAHDARVEDEHVDGCLERRNLVGSGDDAGQVGELDSERRRLARDGIAGSRADVHGDSRGDAGG